MIDASEVAARLMAGLDRVLDRAPLTGMPRGAISAALRAAANEGYARGKTDEHSAWVSRTSSSKRLDSDG